MSDLPPYGYGTAVPVTPQRQRPQPGGQVMQPTQQPLGGQPPSRSQYLAQALREPTPTITDPTSLGLNLMAEALRQDGQQTQQANQQASYLQATNPGLSDDLQQLGIGGQRQNLLQRAGTALGGLFHLGSSGTAS